MNTIPKHLYLAQEKNIGGLSLPSLYYWAANLDVTSLWLKYWNGSSPAWPQVEYTTSRSNSLRALLCPFLPTTVNGVKGNIIVSQSLRIIK